MDHQIASEFVHRRARAGDESALFALEWLHKDANWLRVSVLCGRQKLPGEAMSFFARGWNSLPWGAPLAEFRRRFPRAFLEGNKWRTGESAEELTGTGIRMTTGYMFNQKGQFELVGFDNAPSEVDGQVFFEVFGEPDGKMGTSWSCGPVVLKWSSVMVLVNTAFSDDPRAYENWTGKNRPAAQGTAQQTSSLPWAIPVAQPVAVANGEKKCARCLYLLPRRVCGNQASADCGRQVEQTHACQHFAESPAQIYYAEALAYLARGDGTDDKIAELLTLAIQEGLPEDDEIKARVFLAGQYADIAGDRSSGESFTRDPLLAEALKQLEYAAAVDADRGYALFHEATSRGMLARYDACYILLAHEEVEKRQGPDAAIAYLEDKLSLFRHVPGDPMICMLEDLGARYYNHRRDEDGARICIERILTSEPIPGSEVQEEVKARAIKNLAMLDS
jgi:hypothetical protein